MVEWHVIILVVLMIALALTLVKIRSPLGMAILTGVYSLILAVVFTLLDAVDVALTEAAVGAGITLTLMLAVISLTTREEMLRSSHIKQRYIGLPVAIATGLALMYATFEMPLMGDPSAPSQTHVGDRYLAEGPAETGVPNVVTAVLASYRGYDTLGEVTVIFTAGIAVIALLWRWKEDGE
ncbi:MAG: DUF4040 domain-containing protein [Rhodospirillales bacterium]|nr:DUF4040 domain-containing protein [Rhodospirillales bacterium]